MTYFQLPFHHWNNCGRKKALLKPVIYATLSVAFWFAGLYFYLQEVTNWLVSLCMCSCYYSKASSTAALYVIFRPLWFDLFCALVCRNPPQALVTITKSVSFLDSMTLMICGTFPRHLGSSFHFW